MRRLFIFCLFLCNIVVAAQSESADFAKPHYAPYAFAGGPVSYSMALLAETQGIHYFSLSFILSASDRCYARWNANTEIGDIFLSRALEKLRAQGGDIIVAFGGAGGDDLALICSDVASLTAEYQRVVDELGVVALDFDVEGDEIRDAVSVARRSEAIAQLQAAAQSAGQELFISFTLPTEPTGLTPDGIAVLESALAFGVEIDVVNIMTMNFGGSAFPDAMGANAIQAAESLFAQLQMLYPDKTDAELWNMVGLTPMLGVNDVETETFTLADAEQITSFALEKGIRRLAMWSLERDKECVSGVRAKLPNCSGILQDEFAFSELFNRIMPQK